MDFRMQMSIWCFTSSSYFCYIIDQTLLNIFKDGELTSFSTAFLGTTLRANAVHFKVFVFRPDVSGKPPSLFVFLCYAKGIRPDHKLYKVRLETRTWQVSSSFFRMKDTVQESTFDKGYEKWIHSLMLPFSYWNKLEGGSEEWRTGLGGSELVSGVQGEAFGKWGDLCSEEVTYFHILLSIVNKLLRAGLWKSHPGSTWYAQYCFMFFS